jgi:glucose 1-dehydrogenase
MVDFDFDGKTFIVTGAARGIGEACARRLVRDGARVALWDTDLPALVALAGDLESTTPSTLEAAAGASSPAGPRTHVCKVDVSRRTDIDAALAATVTAFGGVDGLVANAGIFKASDFLAITEADWDAVIDVNLKGTFLCGQAVARRIVEQGTPGSIVNMSSVNARLTIPSIASYNASKGGIDQLTRVMALALADRRIRVNGVAPGTIATELARQAVLTSPEAEQRILSRTPMKRLGEPAEVADVVAYLLSDAASYVTGETVLVDGGRMTLNYTV